MERFEVKAAFEVDAAGVVSGLASVFDTADRGGDIVRKGAFASARAPIPMLASHDQADVVGVWDSLTETAQGLQVKGRLLVADVVRAAEVRALILAGAMTGLSVGYVATKKAPRTGGGRDLFAVDLLEVSIVAVPMHPGAKITAVKAHGAGKESQMLDDVEGFTPEQKALLLAQAENEVKARKALQDALDAMAAKLTGIEKKMSRPGAGDFKPDETTEQKAFRLYFRRGIEGLPEYERKALTLASDPSGGYLAPPEMSGEIIRDIVEISPIRSLASVRGTNAPSVIYMTRKPGGNATWDDESDVETESPMTGMFGQLEVVTKGMTTFVEISNMLMQDAPQAEAEVRAALAEDYEKKETAAFLMGSGVAQPEGILTNTAVLSYNNGHATVLQPDALVKFLYSMPKTYRDKGAWFMNGTTLGLVRTMKDGQNNWLWQAGLQAGQPETILGRPVVEIVDMPDLASGATPIGYGDFSGYRILDRVQLSMLVDPYSQAKRKVTLIHSGRRVGGKVIMPIKFKKLLMAV